MLRFLSLRFVAAPFLLVGAMVSGCDDSGGGSSADESTSAATASSEPPSLPTFDVATLTPVPEARQIVFPPAVDATIAATPATLGQPRCEFAPWERETLVTWDTQTCETIELGPGIIGEFNNASTHFTWIERSDFGQVGTAKLIDLRDGQVTDLDEGDYVRFNGHDQILLELSSTPVTSYSLAGSPVPAFTPTPSAPHVFSASNEYFVDLEGYRMFVDGLPDDPFGRSRIVITHLDGTPLFEVAASSATGIEPHHLAIVDRPMDVLPDVYGSGRQNISLLDLYTGAVEFLANASVDHRLYGNRDFIILAEGLCNTEVTGTTLIIDRSTGEAKRIPLALVGRLLDDGQVQAFSRKTTGFEALATVFFDPMSLEVQTLLHDWVPIMSFADGRFIAPYRRQGGSAPCL